MAQNTLSLYDHLRVFYHYTTPGSLVQICNSATYLLLHAPATRHAALDYVGTFYKIAAFLHIKHNLNQKNPNSREQTDLQQNLVQINSCIETVQLSIDSILDGSGGNDSWPAKLCEWLVDLVGFISSFNSYLDPSRLTMDEVNFLKSMSIYEAVEYWKNQCKTTMDILKLIRKCFHLVSHETRSTMIDFVYLTSSKYGASFDWLLCELAALYPQVMFEKCLKVTFSEFNEANFKLKRACFVKFFSTNFAVIVKHEIVTFLDEMSGAKKSALVFLLRLFGQCAPMMNELLNEALCWSSEYSEQIWRFVRECLVENDPKLALSLVECVKQMSNSVAVFDLASSLINWMSLNAKYENPHFVTSVYTIINTFLSELELSVYSSNSNGVEAVPFLNSLNGVSRTSFQLLLTQIIDFLKDDNKQSDRLDDENKEIFFKFLVCVSISCNDFVSNSIMRELLQLPVRITGKKKELNYSEWPVILKFRQEVNPFHPGSLRQTVKSLCKYFLNEFNILNLRHFVENATLIYSWDLRNKNYMSENISFILIEREVFVSLISQLAIDENIKSQTSYYIIELYTRILKSNEENLPTLKLAVSDLIICANKFVNHFFKLFVLMDENNYAEIAEEVNELNELVKHTLLHLSYSNEEKSPYRNILLRTLVDELFVKIKKDILNKSENERVEMDEDELMLDSANLFSSNQSLLNNEFGAQPNRIKGIRNVLNEANVQKKRNYMMEYKHLVMMSYAYVELLETICSRSLQNTETLRKFEEKKLIYREENERRLEGENGERNSVVVVEQMCNLADLVVQHVLLEQHFVDYQWPASSNEIDENYEVDVDAMRLFIERDVSVQNFLENTKNNKIVWMILEFLALNETSFMKCAPIIRSILASVIIQWESAQEQPTKNFPKILEITTRLLNLLNRVPNLMPKPLCYIVDIIALLNTYETHIVLLMIWRFLKTKMGPSFNKATSQQKPAVDTKQLRFIFQKNISKLYFLYSKFFKNDS